ncbi:MAG: hypothetical protein EXR79_06350 [Myxococcales bacterium]|nr:hypothetical protein [Myxococcales bacterium]
MPPSATCRKDCAAATLGAIGLFAALACSSASPAVGGTTPAGGTDVAFVTGDGVSAKDGAANANADLAPTPPDSAAQDGAVADAGSAAPDTSAPDTSAPDTSAPDTAKPIDTATPADTAAPVLVPFKGSDLLKLFCAAMSTAECHARVTCGSTTDKTTCLAAADMQVSENECQADLRALAKAVEKGGVVFDLDKVKACMANLSWMCGQGTTSYGACRFNAVAGTRKPGDVCAVDEECWPGGFCYRASAATACTGNCKAWAGPGKGCNFATGGSLCTYGEFCNSVKVCEPRKKDGETCPDPGMCEAGLLCIDSKCTPRAKIAGACPKKAGEGCTLGTFGCKKNAAAGSETCKASYVVWAGKGAACDPVGVVPVDALNRRWCRVPFWCSPTSKTCQDGDTAGTACTNKDEEKCGPLQQCEPVGLKCGALPKLGGSCNELCLSPWACSKNKCIERLKDGEACTKGDECGSDKCTAKKCAAVCVVP